jgi:hypothetical protein
MNKDTLTKSINLPDMRKKRFNLLRIPSINVKTVDEYFSKSKKEREWYGLYKPPISLPFDFFGRKETKEKGWADFYKQIKQEYPIQYFFRYWIFSYSNPAYALVKTKLYWPLRDLKWAVRNYIKPCHPRWRKVLPRHEWGDITDLVVTSNFALISDFFHEEVSQGHVNWESDKTHKKFYKELKQVIEWIEINRPKHLQKIEIALDEATKKPVEKKGVFNYEATYSKHNKLEKELFDTDTKTINWFVKNREFFWT